MVWLGWGFFTGCFGARAFQVTHIKVHCCRDERFVNARRK
jgi:hypothetical protein